VARNLGVFWVVAVAFAYIAGAVDGHGRISALGYVVGLSIYAIYVSVVAFVCMLPGAVVYLTALAQVPHDWLGRTRIYAVAFSPVIILIPWYLFASRVDWLFKTLLLAGALVCGLIVRLPAADDRRSPSVVTRRRGRA